MASSDDVTSERSNIFTDEVSDPDLEARLYAEIYYSNETYEPEAEVTKENDTTACIVPNLTALSLSSSNAIDDPQTALRNKDDRPIDNNNTPREAPQTRVPNFARPYYSARHWTLGESHDSNATIESSNSRQKVFKKSRPLTREGLWLQPEIPKDPPTPFRKRLVRTSLRLPELNLNNAQRETEQNRSNDRTTIEEQVRVPITKNTGKKVLKLTRKQQKKEEKRKKLEKAKKLEKLLKKVFYGTGALRRKKAVNSMGVTTETSKYKVVSKKQKLNMKSEDSVDISSDSDDSILEVPIPPKVPPPLIQLPDSDDESEETSGPPSSDNFTPCYVLDSDCSLSSESSDAPTRESPDPSKEVDDESRNDCETLTEISNVEKTPLESDNIVLNCTDLQRGASSLEEIRKIRENEMSEAESTNSVNIAANRASTSRENNEPEVDGNVDKLPKSLWQQLIEENSASTKGANENSMLGCFASPSAENVVSDITENEPNPSIIDNDKETNDKNTRKRQNDEPDVFTNFNVPEIPEKRVRGKTVLTSRDLSLTDYFFKPMSNELKAFYNNPWGGENLDVCDIQSRMTRNPKCWAILDADLRTSPKKRGRRCQRCQTDSHFGKNCPLKSKVPNCCICGVSGHLETRCPQTMCLTCGQKYATFRPTCERCSKFYCNMCNGTGHTRENCPDLWRRYHNTTTELAPVPPKNLRKVMKPQQGLSCCNCAKRGHDETTCKKLRWSQHFPTPMHVISYTNGPDYSSSNNEFAREIDSSECIEIVDIPDDNDILLLEPDNSTSQEKLVFQCFNINDSTGSEMINVRLDTLKNADLRGFVAGRLLPTFLQTWQNNFTFNFRVIRNTHRQIILIIETNCKKLLLGLEKIFIQWITRHDDEKPLLVYDVLPFENVRDMKTELERKMLQLNTSSEPIDILNDIAVFEAKILNLNWESRINGFANKRLKNMRQDNKMLRSAIPSARCALITSLYSRSMIDGGDNILSAFRKLANRFRGSRDGLPVEDYMEIVYLYNEIFIFHKSDALSVAMSRLSQPKITTRSAKRQKALKKSNNTDVRETNSVKSNVAESDDRQSENKQLPETNDVESNQPSTVDSSTAECSNNLEIKDVSDIDPNKDEVTDLYDYHYVQSTPRPLFSDAFLDKKTRKFSRNPNCAKTKPKPSKKDKQGKGLLINLPKEKRDRFKRIANEIIRLANLTENPQLHKEAKSLMYKMNYDMVRKCDIDTLQQRLNRNKKIELEKNREPNSSNANFLSL